MSKARGYGLSFKNLTNDLQVHIENLNYRGYSILSEVLKKEDIHTFIELIEEVGTTQYGEFPKGALASIGEEDVIRMPLTYNTRFIDLLQVDGINEIIENYIGQEYQLHLQNAVVNRRDKEHHQRAWHRDLPYQSWVCSQPLAVNAFFCLSPFNVNTGGSQFVTSSHLMEGDPSAEFLENNYEDVEAAPGDVIIFDSMMLHRAGLNNSDIDRYGVNHVYVRPFIAQQIRLPDALESKFSDDSLLNKILGYKYLPPKNVQDYRRKRLMR